MAITYYGIRNNTNYAITTDGKLLEVGRNRRFNTNAPTSFNENLWTTINSGPHALAIQSNGTLWAWGFNDEGQLGLNDNIERSSPTQVGALSVWARTAPGSQHSLAIQSNGTLWSWGYNFSGQLGNNTSGSSRFSPVQVGALSVWTKIAAQMTSNNLALQSNGTLWAWGSNFSGQLGLSNTTDRSSPTQVGALSNWYQVACGYLSSYAIQSDGTLWVWGRNQSGQLGINTSTTPILSPVQVGSLSVWTEIAGGQFHSIALQSNGTLWSWGSAGGGQLGSSNLTTRSSPVQVGTLSNWAKISCGFNYSLALQSDGTLWSFGLNAQGQLGLGDTTNRSSPVQVIGSRIWRESIGTSLSATVAIGSDGTLWTWGNNSRSTLGYNATSMRSDANQVGLLSSWSRLPGGVSGTAWSLVIDNSNTLYGFGDNTAWRMNYTQAPLYYGVSSRWAIGDGQLISLPTPISSNVSSVSTGLQCAAFIRTDGTLWAWGLNSFSQVGIGSTLPYTLTPKISTFLPNNATSIAPIGAGQNYSISLQPNGTLWSFGRNQFGQLGLNTVIDVSSPVQIGGISTWTQIACGYVHSLAIQSNGTLWAWGNNSFGSLGLGSLTLRSSPAQVGSLSVWTQIALGRGSHSLALQSDGTLWAWGINFAGQLGLSDTNNRSSPTQVGALSVWAQISAGNNHSLALQSNGTLWAWGANSFGALGLSDTISRSSPVQVGALSVWTTIACGYTHNLAIQSNGTLWTWGNGADGRLGSGSTLSRSSPGQVGLLSVWTRIAAGTAHSLSIQSNGTLWAWGNSGVSQLGLNTTTNMSSPVQVGALSVWARISAGFNHSLGVSSNGFLYVWGANSFAQLGDDWNNVYSPIQIGSFSDWTQVMYGTTFAIARRSSGSLWAWGVNNFGQLGNNSTSNMTTPIQIGTLTNWYSIAVGDGFSAATKYDGTLWAWGNNSYGQLGQGNNTHRSIPVQVGRISQYTSVYAMQNTLLANLL